MQDLQNAKSVAVGEEPPPGCKYRNGEEKTCLVSVKFFILRQHLNECVVLTAKAFQLSRIHKVRLESRKNLAK